MIEHCAAVSDLAMELAERLNIPVDRDLLFMGAMLHDIGRGRTNSIKHAVAGAEAARRAGVPEEVGRIRGRQVGAGLTGEEARSLGLPPGEYMPQTPEEIIVSYADN
ncbi:MAG: HDIG domain-containing protein, partial [Methanobacteriota archaeon]